MKYYNYLLLVTIFAVIFLPAALYSDNTPFDENAKVVLTEKITVDVQDVDIAEAAEMVVNEGFPVAGTVSCGNSTLRLRTWPWGDVISNHTSGTSITVIGESGEFFLVEIDGKQGYMHKNYVSIPESPASGEAPDYPGDTANGGALSLTAGVKASKAGAASKAKVATSTSASSSSSSASSSSSSSSTSGSSQKPTVGSNGKVVINVPQKCQMKVKCPAPGSACGPTSLAMILSYYTGKNVDALATDLWSVCGATAANGTGHSGLQKGAKKYGYPNAKWHFCVTQSWVREQLKAGKPILAHVKGHYVVIKGIDDSGKIYFNDPGRSAVDRSMSFSEFSAWWRGAGSTHPCMVLE